MAEQPPEVDPLYSQALDLVVKNQKASISLVQRHLKIGYNRAAALMEALEVGGIVSAMSSSGQRAVLQMPAGEAPPPDDAAPAGNVVPLSSAKKGAAPRPVSGAAAPEPGAGGDSPAAGPKAAKAPKKEKTIDWGKYSYLLENFTLIYGTDTVWDGGKRMIMKLANMAHAHGADMVKIWKASERRRTVMQEDVVFDPTNTCDPEHCINLFDGFRMEPQKGDVKPILDLIRFLCSRAGEESDECDQIMHWLMCWFAYPLQHPGAKLRTSVVMHGDEGAGKNMLFDLVASIYGKYGALVGQDELEDKFNDWRSCKLFVVGDEVSSRQELVHNKNRLKALITSPTVQINPKNLPRREEANHMNVGFLSNEITPLALDNSDRRYLVVYTPRAKPFAYYKALGQWRDTGGTEAFYAYLLDYPLADFDPYAPAPATAAKRDLIDINRKSAERFWLEWHSGEIDLPYHPCAVQQAYRAYLKYAQRVGDRFPVQRPTFTRMVLRMAEAEDSYAQEKVMTPPTLEGRKSVRMFLTLPPPEEEQGKWAAECVESFEKALMKYLGIGSYPRSPGDESSGNGGAE
ncbi:DNA segregation ATPase, FtsK/SpoIIIE family [Polaromonas sp. CF318]|nr:DNA segregation ATPase, FtsK/SpoIIIE family [Polaromonas sp. CF318]